MQGYDKLSSRFLMPSWRALVVFLTVTFSVALIGSLITAPALADWYLTLQKPAFTPPGWVFGAAWTFNYSAMAVAYWLVYLQRKTKPIGAATVWYHLQLSLNLLWVILFFGMHNPGLAFGEIILLQLANIGTAIAFFNINRLSGYLFIPYICWVSLACVLNCYVWIANY